MNKKLVIFDYNGVLNREDLKETVVTLSFQYLLAVVSSSPDKYIIDYLESEGMENYFNEISGSDVHKSKVVKINLILEKYKVSPKDTVFITDSLYDILDGNSCGVKSIGVTWGLHDKNELNKGNPIVIIDDVTKLLSAIQNVLK